MLLRLQPFSLGDQAAKLFATMEATCSVFLVAECTPATIDTR